MLRADTHIFAHIARPETNTRRIIARLEREGWQNTGGGKHDVFKHPERPGRIVVPPHREQSIGVARSIARQAGWV